MRRGGVEREVGRNIRPPICGFDSNKVMFTGMPAVDEMKRERVKAVDIPAGPAPRDHKVLV